MELPEADEPVEAAPVKQPEAPQPKMFNPRAALSKRANAKRIDYLDYLSTVCIVPYDKLDHFRNLLGLNGQDTGILAPHQLRVLISSVNAPVLNEPLVDYVLVVLGVNYQIAPVYRNFRLYAAALLAEAVANLPSSTRQLIQQVDLSNANDLASFDETKRTFVTLDHARTGMVNLEDMLDGLGMGVRGPMGRQLCLLLQTVVNPAGDISLLDLMVRMTRARRAMHVFEGSVVYLVGSFV